MFDIISPILFILILAGLGVLIYFVVILYKNDQQQQEINLDYDAKNKTINTGISDIKTVDANQDTTIKMISTDLLNKASAITSLQGKTEANTSSITSMSKNHDDLLKTTEKIGNDIYSKIDVLTSNGISQGTKIDELNTHHIDLAGVTGVMIDFINIQGTSIDELKSNSISQIDMLQTQQDLLNDHDDNLASINTNISNYDKAFTSINSNISNYNKAFTYNGTTLNLKTPVSFTGPQAVFNGSTIKVNEGAGKSTWFNNKNTDVPTNMITGDTSVRADNKVIINAPTIRFNGVVSVCDVEGKNCKNI